MSDLIEGMAKKLAEVNSSPFGRVRWQDFVLDAQAAFDFLADPQNISPEMVEPMARALCEASGDHPDNTTQSGEPKWSLWTFEAKGALTAALTAAKEG